MNATQNVTFRQVAADLRLPYLREEWRTAWSIAPYRFPSVPLVWLLARAGLTPMAVSGLALLVAVLLPALALWLPLGWAPWAVAIAAALFQMLDCADGMLARVTGATSKTGGDMDFLVDMAQWGLLYLAIGILADRSLGGDGAAAVSWGWTALAALAGWGRLLARVIRDRLAGPEDAIAAPLRLVDWPAAFVSGLSGVIPFLALSGDWLGAAVIALMVYSALDIAEGLLPVLAALRRG